MAYISAQETRAIRARLKAAFPKFKFSVRNQNHTSVSVTILSGPVRFAAADNQSLNEYHPYQYENSDIFKLIILVVNRDNYDNSDIQTDYFDVGYYTHFSQGDYNKPYEVTT